MPDTDVQRIPMHMAFGGPQGFASPDAARSIAARVARMLREGECVELDFFAVPQLGEEALRELVDDVHALRHWIERQSAPLTFGGMCETHRTQLDAVLVTPPPAPRGLRLLA